MKRFAVSNALTLALLILIAGCGLNPEAPSSSEDSQSPNPSSVSQTAPQNAKPAEPPTLAEARRGFVTKLVEGPQPSPDPIPAPPPNLFRLVKYKSPAGDLSAYVTPDPGDGAKRPAIIWITGGDCNSIGELWEPKPRENDQSAAAYRKAGIVMMFPSLRGGNDNPGRREGFLGEVDDVLAAADHLAKLPYVDPNRIYLGGHSTGGTLVMLVAASSDRFRAVFAFGPVADIRGYQGQFVYHQPNDPKENRLRSPIYWLDAVRAPLFVIEGRKDGNEAALLAMQRQSKNPAIRFTTVSGFDHFSILAPANEAITDKIIEDTGPTSTITLSEQELQGQP